MNGAIKAIIAYMLNRKVIGAKHTQEEKLIKSKTKWLNKEELRVFRKQYKKLLGNQLILRLKKRTGKGSDWHISLNPRKLRESYEMILK
jgi:hypothetical protein